MPKPFDETISKQWKEKVLSQRQSGLSIATWCRQNNVAPHIFYYWRDKFFPKPSIGQADFKEIPEQANNESHKSGIHLQYQEICIHLDRQFDVITLKQCLKAVKELIC